MKLPDLLQDIFDMILKIISPIIEPIINKKGKNAQARDEIKSIINDWFDKNDVFSLSVERVNKISEDGTIFTNENNVTITVEGIIKRFRDRDIVENVKTALFEHYGIEKPNIQLISCPTGMKPFVQTDKKGQVESFGCINNRRFRR